MNRFSPRLIVLCALLVLAALGFTALRWWTSGAEAGQEQSPAVKALVALGQSEAPDAPASLAAALDKARERDARLALYSLGRLKTAPTERSLQYLLQNATASHVRGMAADLLGQYDNAPVSTLSSLAMSDPAPEVRLGAMRGLLHQAKVGQPAGGRAFAAGLTDSNPLVRAAAIEGASRLMGQRYLYQPELDPQSQRERIAFIRQQLAKAGLLR